MSSYSFTHNIAPAHLTFDNNGTPFSEIYGDIYHSAFGGPAQAKHVFLSGNGLPERWREREDFVILETGFGLGLNFLVTWFAWRNHPRCQRLRFISLEKHPFTACDLSVAHALWPEFSDLSEALCARWPTLITGHHRLEPEDGVELTLVFGDAEEMLPGMNEAVDAFYLDGFSPARNPELWSPALFRNLARLAKPDTTLSTWSVAGIVRRALIAAGFSVKKRPGFAGKREMLIGRLLESS